jgi:hypothetical protein
MRLRLSEVNPWTREAILEVVRPNHPTAVDAQFSSVLDTGIEPALPADEVALMRQPLRGTPHRDALRRFGQSLEAVSTSTLGCADLTVWKAIWLPISGFSGEGGRRWISGSWL